MIFQKRRAKSQFHLVMVQKLILKKNNLFNRQDTIYFRLLI